MFFVTSISASPGNCSRPSVVVLGCDVAPAALTRGAGPCPAGAGGEEPTEADDTERCSTSGPRTVAVRQYKQDVSDAEAARNKPHVRFRKVAPREVGVVKLGAE